MSYTAGQIELGERQQLGVLAHDATGELVGGVTGRLAVRWLLIHVAWVAEAYRGTGLGRQLMTAIESEAIERGCIGAQVDTLSVQAPGFYTRLGYAIVGTVPDCPPGHARHFLAKRFMA